MHKYTWHQVKAKKGDNLKAPDKMDNYIYIYIWLQLNRRMGIPRNRIYEVTRNDKITRMWLLGKLLLYYDFHAPVSL